MNQSKMINSKISTLNKSMSTNSIFQYQEKLQNVYQINMKLKQLYQIMKNNNVDRKRQMNQNSQQSSQSMLLAKIKKQQTKLQNQNQQLINNLNGLTNQNAKLKAQVDNSRNSRVIYSNIYKNLQKQIKKHEYLYRVAIIDYLQYEEVQTILQQKMRNVIRKLQKQVIQLEGGCSKVVKKKQKDIRKSRLDTGLKSTSRGQSMQTSRAIEQQMKNNLKKDDHVHQNSTNLSKQCKNMIKQQSNQETIPSSPLQNSKKPLYLQKKYIKGILKSQISQKSPIQTQKTILPDYYEIQMESQYYQNITKHLKQISELQNINQIATLWFQIDQNVQSEYNQYLQYEQKIKKLDYQTEELVKIIQIQKNNSSNIKTIQEEQLSKVIEEIEKQQIMIEDNQNKLTQMIDINTHKLKDNDIMHHVLRIKRKGQTNNRQLQQLFQNVRKQKNFNTKTLKTSRMTQK